MCGMILVTVHEVKKIKARQMKSSVTENVNLKMNLMSNDVNDLIPIHRMAGRRAYPHFIKSDDGKNISHNDYEKNIHQIILVIANFFILFFNCE